MGSTKRVAPLTAAALALLVLGGCAPRESGQGFALNRSATVDESYVALEAPILLDFTGVFAVKIFNANEATEVCAAFGADDIDPDRSFVNRFMNRWSLSVDGVVVTDNLSFAATHPTRDLQGAPANCVVFHAPFRSGWSAGSTLEIAS